MQTTDQSGEKGGLRKSIFPSNKKKIEAKQYLHYSLKAFKERERERGGG